MTGLLSTEGHAFRHWCYVVTIWATLILASSAAHAVPPAAASATAIMPLAAPSLMPELLKLVLGTLVVAAILLLLQRLLRHMTPRPGKHALQILATLPLSPKERVVMIQVKHEQLLLGVAAGQISLLRVLSTDPASTAAASSDAGQLETTEDAPLETSGSDFRNRLMQLLHRNP